MQGRSSQFKSVSQRDAWIVKEVKKIKDNLSQRTKDVRNNNPNITATFWSLSLLVCRNPLTFLVGL